MTHDTLVTRILAANCAILVVLLSLLIRFIDRSDAFAKALQGHEALVDKIRRMVARKFQDHFGPALSGLFPRSGVTSILDAHGEAYSESKGNFVESELFKDMLRDFINAAANLLSDYKIACSVKQRWCRWGRILSWSLLGAVIWLALTTTGVFVEERLRTVALDERLLKWTFVGIVVPGVLIISAFVLQLVAHDKLTTLRSRYEAT
jgi:hypothetical protein